MSLQAYSLSFFLFPMSAWLAFPLATTYAMWFLLGEQQALEIQ